MHATSITKNATGPFLDEVVLDYEDRRRRRIVMTGIRGNMFLLDLGAVTDLRDGDGIVLSSGQTVLVRAASEPLLEVHARDSTHLVRIAWHIGNRHLAAEIGDRAIRIRADHVIAAMVEGLGGHVHKIDAPFNPEGGAYDAAGAAGRGHAHDTFQGHSHHRGDRDG